ncbi:hypothetical protein L6R50_10425 [Myxococcota bacterium]|nr:hypothetical protein [Myxococcota bacterium]
MSHPPRPEAWIRNPAALLVLAASLLWGAPPARADDGGEGGSAETTSTDDDGGFFDDPPAAPDPEAEKLARRLAVGRSMREAHQRMALATLFTLIGAEVVGTVNAVQRRQGTGAVPEAGLAAHRILAGTATGLYLTTGTLVWAAPKGPRSAGSSAPAPGHVDSSKVHRALSVLHGIGMGAQLVTGFLMANVASGADYEALLTAHLVSGYATVGLMSAAGIVITFF